MKKALQGSEGFLHSALFGFAFCVAPTAFYRTPQLAPGYVGAAVGLLSQYILAVKVSAAP